MVLVLAKTDEGLLLTQTATNCSILRNPNDYKGFAEDVHRLSGGNEVKNRLPEYERKKVDDELAKLKGKSQ